MPGGVSDWIFYNYVWENWMTKTKLAKYVKRLKYWQGQFNLMDYELLPVVSEEINDEETQDIVAAIQWHHGNRWVKININEDWNGTDREINRVAFHEMLELRLGKLRDMAKEKYNWDEVDEQIHIVIRSLENMVLNK